MLLYEQNLKMKTAIQCSALALRNSRTLPCSPSPKPFICTFSWIKAFSKPSKAGWRSNSPSVKGNVEKKETETTSFSPSGCFDLQTTYSSDISYSDQISAATDFPRIAVMLFKVCFFSCRMKKSMPICCCGKSFFAALTGHKNLSFYTFHPSLEVPSLALKVNNLEQYLVMKWWWSQFGTGLLYVCCSGF